MIKKEFMAGDIIYDDVVVPTGTEINETFDEANKSMTIDCTISRVGKVTYSMNLSRCNPLCPPKWNLTEDDMRKIIVSGFIDFAKRNATRIS